MANANTALAEISKITDSLYICGVAQTERLDDLSARNIRLVISMIGGQRPHNTLSQPPFSLLWLQTFDTPLTPIPIGALMQGVQAALPIIQGGGSVLTFCIQGRHRSVAMGAAILIGLGYASSDAMELIRSQRAIADPYTRHIRWQILRFERYWQSREHPTRTFGSRLHEAYSTSVTGALAGMANRIRLPGM